MDDHDGLAERFEAQRGQLRAVAYRMLGSLSEADDAVQEAWLRLGRADLGTVGNLGGWLTTVVARICLDMLRARSARREEPLGVHLPEPILDRRDGVDPEHETLLAEGVGLALLVVLDALGPAERVAFVLHDLFAVPFDQVGAVLGRSEAAARQLASRARRRVQGAAPAPDPDLAGQHRVVDAFLAAARGGDLQALVALLDPEVVARADGGPRRRGAVLHGADAVAGQAVNFARIAEVARPALVNGAAGLVAATADRPIAVLAFTIRGGRIVALDILTDPERLRRLDLAALDR
jgi:RNA polymerase sigma factor (sigma-70 family)